MKKEKSLLIRMEEQMYQHYKILCKEHGFNMTQRIRNFIKNEIEIYNKKNG
jgi:hypothetical protein